MLKVVDVTKCYGKETVLENLSLELGKGEVVALLGPNGSGKSTLLSIMALSLKPDSGKVDVDGLALSDARKIIAYAPQVITLFEELNTRENLYAWSGLRGNPMKERAEELVTILGMENFLKRRVSKLSGGQRRRVNLAVSLMSPADYIVLDEPLAGVDSEGIDRIIDLISEERKKGRGIIISEHNSEVVSGFADKVIHLDKGRLI